MLLFLTCFLRTIWKFLPEENEDSTEISQTHAEGRRDDEWQIHVILVHCGATELYSLTITEHHR